MKTPLEILLARHQAAEPQLDEIRRRVLDRELRRPSDIDEPGSTNKLLWPIVAAHKLWRELVFPCRHAWGGLTAVWLVIIGFQIAVREPSPPRRTSQPASESSQLREVFREREQELAELVAPNAKSGSESTSPVHVSPRSQGDAAYLNT